MNTEKFSNALSSVINVAVEKRPESVSEADLAINIAKIAFYFVLLFVTWGHSIKDLFRMGRMKFTVLSLLLFFLALWNVIEAWILIFKWLEREYNTSWYAHGGEEGGFHWSKWLIEVDLFVGAYEQVVMTFSHWFWSSQLLHFVPSLVVFTYVEFYRAGAKRPFSNFMLGCLAAISLCFPYVLHVALNSSRSNRRSRIQIPPGRFLIVCVLLASIATILLPRTEDEAFGAVLAVLHITLLAPLFFAQMMPKEFLVPKFSDSLATTPDSLTKAASISYWIPMVYCLLAGIAGVTHLFNFLTVIGNLSMDAPDGKTNQLVSHILSHFCANECQCSISNDVARAGGVFMAVLFWMTVFRSAARRHGEDGSSRFTNLILFLLTPFLSVGTTFPIWAALRELNFLQNPYTYEERLMAMFIRYMPDSLGIKREKYIAKKKADGKPASSIEQDKLDEAYRKAIEKAARSKAAQTLSNYSGTEEVLLQNMVRKYGLEPADAQLVKALAKRAGSSNRASSSKQQQQQQQQKQSSSTTKPGQSSGSPTKKPLTAENLKKSSAAATTTTTTGGKADDESPPSPTTTGRIKRNLKKFYIAQGMEDKMSGIDAIIDKWGKNEKGLYKALMAKYPEAFDSEGKILVKKEVTEKYKKERAQREKEKEEKQAKDEKGSETKKTKTQETKKE